MSASQLKFYSYISRAKINQLHDQITEYAVETRSVRRGKTGQMQAEVGTSGLFGFLKGGFKLASKKDEYLEEVRQESYIHKLEKVLEHIEKYEKVQDLGLLCRNAAGVPLRAFCYKYSGRFFTLARCCALAATPQWSEKPTAYAAPTRIAFPLSASRYRLQRECLLALMWTDHNPVGGRSCASDRHGWWECKRIAGAALIRCVAIAWVTQSRAPAQSKLG